MFFNQISDFDTRLKTKISENIFAVLPDEGVFMVVFDDAGRTIASHENISENLFKNKSIFKRMIQMLGDGCGSITSTIASKPMLGFELAHWQDTQLYAAVVFQNLSVDDASRIDDIFELTMNQFIGLADYHINRPQSKEHCTHNKNVRFVYN